MPEALCQRIAVYNKQHGSEPPANTEVKAWNPKLMPPVHNNKQHTVRFAPNDQQSRNRIANPFQNIATKIKTNNNAQINVFKNEPLADDEEIIDNIITDDEEYNQAPSLFSFIASQDCQAQLFSIKDDDDDPNLPIICSFDLPENQSIAFAPNAITSTNPVPNQIDDYTPDKIKLSLQNVHQNMNYRPSKRFLSQHAAAIS